MSICKSTALATYDFVLNDAMGDKASEDRNWLDTSTGCLFKLLRIISDLHSSDDPGLPALGSRSELGSVSCEGVIAIEDDRSAWRLCKACPAASHIRGAIPRTARSNLIRS